MSRSWICRLSRARPALTRLALAVCAIVWLHSFGANEAVSQDESEGVATLSRPGETSTASILETDTSRQMDFVEPMAEAGDLGAVGTPGHSIATDAAGVSSTPDVRALLKRIETLESAEKKRGEADRERADGERLRKDEERRKAEGWLDVSDDKWTVKLGGHVQIDYVNWADGDPKITGPAAAPGTKDYFEFRRLRLTADGAGYGLFDFRFQLTLEPESVGESPPGSITSPELKDAYFSINEVPYVGRVRIGHFFVPFSLEQVTNDSFGLFLERSIPSQGIFAPGRELGIALYNATEDRRVTWSGGAFVDSLGEGLKEKIDDNQGYRVGGRLTWLPYYDEPSDGRYLVHTGVGVLHTNDSDNRLRLSARPHIHEGPRLIDTGVVAADHYTTGNLEAAIVWGPLAVQSEAFVSRVSRTDADAVQFHGMYAHVSWFLTGENRVYERFGQHGAQFGRNVPFSNFFMTRGGCGPGAWEAKTRWSHLNFDAVDQGRYDDLTVGLNWYWSDRTRLMFDWIHPMTSDDTTFGSTRSDILGTRFDFNW